MSDVDLDQERKGKRKKRGNDRMTTAREELAQIKELMRWGLHRWGLHRNNLNWSMQYLRTKPFWWLYGQCIVQMLMIRMRMLVIRMRILKNRMHISAIRFRMWVQQ
jgi:hypothetical protein